MSADDTGDESIFTKFKNLVLYKINNAVSDPNADKYAAEKAKKREEKKKEEQFDPQINTTVNTVTPNPRQFSAKRFFNTILNQTISILKRAFFPFIALMLAMIVANEMMIYTVPVRIIFFIFTFLVCFFTPPLCIIVGLFYILKGAYSYYINNMTGKKPEEKIKIMPTIYAMLPITTYTPESSIGKFFYYPFRYPKSAISEVELPTIMPPYLKDLKESFKDFDSVKNQPIFAEQLKQLEIKFKNFHDITKINSTPPSKVPGTPEALTPVGPVALGTPVGSAPVPVGSVPGVAVAPPAYNHSRAPKIPTQEVRLGGGLK